MLFMLPILFGSIVSYACPDLTGKYLCQALHGTYDLKFNKTSSGYIVTTESTKKTYVTDGSVQELPDLGETVQNRTLKSYCDEEKFIIDYEATVYYEGNVLGQQFSKTSYEFNGKNIQMILQVNFQGSNLPPIKETCVPKK